MDCFGGLYEAVINTITQGEGEKLLLYLCNCYVLFRQLDIKKIQKSFGQDPWEFQFLKVVNYKGESLFNYVTQSEILEYGKNCFGIEYERVNDKEINLYSFMKKNYDKYILLQVDSFYCPTSSNYKKRHGLHYFLLLGYDKNSKEIYFFETENGVHHLDIKIIEEAVNHRLEYSFHYLINKKCNNYSAKQLKYDVPGFEKLWTSFFQVACKSKKALQDYFNSCETINDTQYIYEAFSQITLFQIMPIIRLRSIMFDDIAGKVLKNRWETLGNFTLKERAKREYSPLVLLEKLESILEPQYYTQIGDLQFNLEER